MLAARSFDPLSSWSSWSLQTRFFRAWVPSRVYCSQQFLSAHSERTTCPATRRIDQPAVFIPMIRPLSNSLNCEECLLARLPGMFRLPKSTYNRQVIVTFMNLRLLTAVLHKELESIDSSVLYLVLRLAWCCDLVFDGGRGFRKRIQWGRRWLAWRSESANEMDDGSEHEFRLRLTDFRKRNQW
ncbi:uncharacterized protein TNCV_4608501 [Trichonephila clavipes]|nr:uncharacterized protein TNCV_4608501 [Trichonephila clavipes]